MRGQYELEYFPENYTEIFPPPDYSFNILYRHGLLYQPVLDQAFLESYKRKPVWPEEKDFAVCLTHDVDRVSQFCRHQALRRFGRSLSSVGKGRTREYIGRLLGRLKIIKNSLQSIGINNSGINFPLTQRPEQLSVAELVELSNLITYGKKRY